MKIDPAIVRRHWEQATVDQLAVELERDGYAVERDVQLGNVRADLVARRADGPPTVYEIRLPGRGDQTGWAAQAMALREAARQRGGRFKLVVVRPPRDVAVEIDGLEDAMRAALQDDLPVELATLSPRTRVDGVGDVVIARVALRDKRLELAGEGDVTVTLVTGEGTEVATETFPLSFEALFSPDDGTADLINATVDLSSWYGAEAD